MKENYDFGGKQLFVPTVFPLALLHVALTFFSPFITTQKKNVTNLEVSEIVCNFASRIIIRGDMDVAFLLDRYFKGTNNVSIDVFDAQTLNAVYRDVIKILTSHFEIEVSVLQALSYCLYEVMDNVHIHSGKPLGTAMTYYDSTGKTLRILIADDGIGIKASLAENSKYRDVTESEALNPTLTL